MPVHPPAPFPANRPRRLRAQPWIRAMVAEHTLSPADFIWPCFVVDGEDRARRQSVGGVGVCRHDGTVTENLRDGIILRTGQDIVGVQRCGGR